MSVSRLFRRLAVTSVAALLVGAFTPELSHAADTPPPAAVPDPSKPIEQQFADLMKEQGDMRLFNEIAVIGEIKSPGKVKIGAFSRMTLVDVLGKCGGTKPGSDLRAIRIFRLSPDGANETHTEDLSPRPGERPRKFRMQPGDIVWVPVEK